MVFLTSAAILVLISISGNEAPQASVQALFSTDAREPDSDDDRVS